MDAFLPLLSMILGWKSLRCSVQRHWQFYGSVGVLPVLWLLPSQSNPEVDTIPCVVPLKLVLSVGFYI